MSTIEPEAFPPRIRQIAVVTAIEPSDCAIASEIGVAAEMCIPPGEPGQIRTLEEAFGPQQAIGLTLALRAPVWKLGEILLLGGDDRTIPDGRKPSKWSVRIQEVDSIEAAAELAQQVVSDAFDAFCAEQQARREGGD